MAHGRSASPRGRGLGGRKTRLQRFEAEAACKVQDGAQSTQAPRAPPDLVAEVEQLRGKVIELHGQNRELQGSSKRQAIGATPMCRPGPRLQEDFVPMCNEDIMRWMEDWQADIHEATTAGNAHEVARLCRVMGSAAAEWSTPSTLPSMQTNSVRYIQWSPNSVANAVMRVVRFVCQGMPVEGHSHRGGSPLCRGRIWPNLCWPSLFGRIWLGPHLAKTTFGPS